MAHLGWAVLGWARQGKAGNSSITQVLSEMKEAE
jgi:hypothetical protein